MNPEENLRNYYRSILAVHTGLLLLTPYKICEYLNTLKSQPLKGISLHDSDAIDNLMEKIQACNHSISSALHDHDLRLLRKGISAQLAAVYTFTIAVDGLTSPVTRHYSLLIPNSYSDYCSAVKSQVDNFLGLDFNAESTETTQNAIDLLVANLLNLPEFSKFNFDHDTLDLALSQLSGKEPYLSYVSETSIWN